MILLLNCRRKSPANWPDGSDCHTNAPAGGGNDAWINTQSVAQHSRLETTNPVQLVVYSFIW